MGNDTPRQVLSGRKALVVDVANDQSIAYGCARAFRELGDSFVCMARLLHR
jgi:enoyl-[acyl-carrier protein] reductase I